MIRRRHAPLHGTDPEVSHPTRVPGYWIPKPADTTEGQYLRPVLRP
ncbi:hypothetical protein SAMN04487915_111114 [Arthrobacter sp. ov118]|nr:hypothetical protein SAMN04487915_111114 [Arthrobacter sp. ov118]